MTIEQIEERVQIWNGAKVGKKNPIANSFLGLSILRNKDKKIQLPKGWTIQSRTRTKEERKSFFLIDKESKQIITPVLNGSNWLRTFNRHNKNQFTIGDRPVIWLLCSMMCQKRKADKFEFGVYDSNLISVDHQISRNTLYRWFIKGLIDKSQFNHCANLVLMRLSENKSKGARPQTDNIYSTIKSRFISNYDTNFKNYKSLLNIFLRSKSGKLLLSQPNDTIRKLGIWYVCHQLTGGKFYQQNKTSDPTRYWIDMIEKYHIEESEDMILF